MYEEIIAALRFCDNGECDGCCKYIKGKGTECYTLLRDAADAIEELQKQALEWQKSRDLERSLCAVMEKLIPRWIPVTERLPEDGSLVGKLIADSDGCIRIASQCAVITLSGGKTVYTDLIDLVSFLAKDTPTTEWADCTHITHWMPLPEPPKEES